MNQRIERTPQTLPVPRHADRRPNPLFVAHLKGTQAEMGAQHGAMVREVGNWRPAVEFYPLMPSRLLAAGSPLLRWAIGPVIEWALRRMERRRDPELRARNKAFLKAVGVTHRWSRYSQVMDVFQNLVNLAAAKGLGPWSKLPLAERVGFHFPQACSTLVAWGSATEHGNLLHARNFDFPGIGVWDRNPAVVFCTPNQGLRYGFVSSRGADVPGITAFNEAGLSITAHTRFHRDATFSGRSIVDLTHDIVRGAKTLAEAEAIARQTPIASTWGLCISSAAENRAISLECNSAGVRVIEPGEGEEWLVVTNHYKSDFSEGQIHISPGFNHNTVGRWSNLTRLGQRGGLSVHDMQRALCGFEDADVSGFERAGGTITTQAITVQSVVIDPANQRLNLSVGPAPTGLGPWHSLDWAWGEEPSYYVERFDGGGAAALTTHSHARFTGGDEAEAYQLYIEAAEELGRGGSPAIAKEHLEEAIALDDADPVYRLLAGGLALKMKDPARALEHFEAGLAREKSPFYRAQLLLWASRAAVAVGGRDEDVVRWREAIAASDHAMVADFKRDAEKEATTPVKLGRLKKTSLNFHFAELRL